jgi:nucleoside-diphosphate-sugar epimerase
MKIFVTGGSGYIGRPTITALISAGAEVTALVRSDTAAAAVTGLGATPVAGDLTDTDVLRAAARAAEGVIHLGQHPGPDSAAVDRAAAEALQDGAGVHPYVHTGGVWVYGDTDGIVDEDAPLDPPRLTAWRLENEKRVLARAATGERPVVVMPGMVYGRSGGLIETFYAAPGRAAGAVPVIGDGANHWALVHVDDIADLYVRALSAPAGAVYAGVVDRHPTALEAATALSHGLGLGGAVRRLTTDEADDLMGPLVEPFSLDQRLTSARARRDLGWSPAHTDPVADLTRY